MRRIATLTEIESSWSLNDLFDANEALDIMDDLEAQAHEEAQQKQRR